MKPVCLHCENTEFEEREITANPKTKGEDIKVKAKAFVCTNCGFESMDSKQMNALRKSGVDEYRRQKGLLTSSDIKKFRKDLELSQEDFAAYIKVGVASLKRWEASILVQDAGSDDLIRLKCSPDEAKDNVIHLNKRIESLRNAKSHSKDENELEYG